MAQVVVSASNRVLLHDTSMAKQSCYNTSTSGGTGLQPKLSLANSHFQGAVVTALAWSHNN